MEELLLVIKQSIEPVSYTHLDVYKRQAWNISHHVKRVSDLKEIFENCDYITVHVPLTPDTKGTFNADAFSLMQKGTTIINFARAELVENDALFDALETGVVKRYITDFGTEELLNKPNVTVFPHVGGSTGEAELNCAIMAGQTIRRFMETGEIVNSVNFPRVQQVLSAPYRITDLYKRQVSIPIMTILFLISGEQSALFIIQNW